MEGIQIKNPNKNIILLPVISNYKETIKPIKWFRLILIFILEIISYIVSPILILFSLKLVPFLVTFTPPVLLGIFLAMLIIVVWMFINLGFKELKYNYCNFH